MIRQTIKYLVLAIAAYVVWIGFGRSTYDALQVQKALVASVPRDANTSLSVAVKDAEKKLTSELERLKLKIPTDDLSVLKGDDGRWVLHLNYAAVAPLFKGLKIETAFSISSLSRNPFTPPPAQ
jgi:hypothetical protein